MRYKISLFLLFVVCSIGLARFTHRQTKGFRLAKIAHNTSPLHMHHTPLVEIDGLDRPFTYLGRGLQSFCFVSEDQTTVLKIFNNRYQNRLFWLNLPFGFGPWKQWREEKINTTLKKWTQTFQSYHLANDQLKEEANLLYVHLNPCQECPPVTLIDPLGIKHTVSLASHAFVFQKRGTLTYDYIEQCLEKEEKKKAKEAILSLVTLMRQKMDKGIDDCDPLIRANFGFYQDKPMQIDIGPFRLNPSLQDKHLQKEKLCKMTLGFKHWLENNHPELVSTLDDALDII